MFRWCVHKPPTACNRHLFETLIGQSQQSGSRSILTGIHSISAQSLRQPWPSLFVDSTMDFGNSVVLLQLKSESRTFLENQRTCFYIGLLFSMVEIVERTRVLMRDFAKGSLKFYGTPWIGWLKLNVATSTSWPLNWRFANSIGEWRVSAACVSEINQYAVEYPKREIHEKRMRDHRNSKDFRWVIGPLVGYCTFPLRPRKTRQKCQFKKNTLARAQENVDSWETTWEYPSIQRR